MHQNDGNAAGLAGLHQGLYLREFIERTEAAGQHHVVRGVFDEHDLARKKWRKWMEISWYSLAVCSCGRTMLTPMLGDLPAYQPLFASSIKPGPPPLTQ